MSQTLIFFSIAKASIFDVGFSVVKLFKNIIKSNWCKCVEIRSHFIIYSNQQLSAND